MIKRKLGMPQDRPLANYLPYICTKTKDFTAEIQYWLDNKYNKLIFHKSKALFYL